MTLGRYHFRCKVFAGLRLISYDLRCSAEMIRPFLPPECEGGIERVCNYFPWLGVEQYEFPRRVNVVVCGMRVVWRGR
jgi:hypothetical protein